MEILTDRTVVIVEKRKDDGVKDGRVTQRWRRQMELKVRQESLREGRAAGHTRILHTSLDSTINSTCCCVSMWTGESCILSIVLVGY